MLFLFALSLLAPTPSLAQPPAPETNPLSPAATPSSDRFRLIFSPYAWATGFSGNATVRSVPIGVTSSFTDILSSTDTVIGLMGALDLEVDRFVFQLNSTWSKASVERARGVPPVASVSADVIVNSGWVERFGSYRLLDMPIATETSSRRRFTLDAFASSRSSSSRHRPAPRSRRRLGRRKSPRARLLARSERLQRAGTTRKTRRQSIRETSREAVRNTGEQPTLGRRAALAALIAHCIQLVPAPQFGLRPK